MWITVSFYHNVVLCVPPPFCVAPSLVVFRNKIHYNQKVAPVPSSGIEKLETDTFKLQSFQTLTGVKFVITAEAGTPDLGAVLQEIYELYTDYVLKVTRYVFVLVLPRILLNYCSCDFS